MRRGYPYGITSVKCPIGVIMIIFNFGPLSKNELILAFDNEGASYLFQRLSGIGGNKDEETMACIHLDKQGEWVGFFTVYIDDFDTVNIDGHHLKIGLDEGSLEYLVFKLEKFLSDGDFSPSEFIALSRPGRKYDTQVYLRRIA